MFRPVTSAVSALWGFVANGHQAVHHVSSSPSKIPYGGFSPVRLQTEWANRHLRRRVLARRLIGGQRIRHLSTLALTGNLPSQAVRGTPGGPLSVQRPLARQRVVLSRQLKRYYGLIRASDALRPAYVFTGRSLPLGRTPEGPQFKLRVCASVPFPVPRRIRWPSTVVLPPVLAFARFAGARHPHAHLSRFLWRFNEAAEFALCCGPEAWLALHRQGRLLSSFHPMSHLTGTSNMTTRQTVNLPRPDFHRLDTQPYGLRAKQTQFFVTTCFTELGMTAEMVRGCVREIL